MPFAAYARAFSLPQKSYSDHIRELHYRIETAQEKMERKSRPGDFSQQSNHRRRNPLGDGTATANVNNFKSKSDQKEKSPIKPDNSVPMNESLVANRTVAARHTTNSPKNQRISQISSAAPSDSKRNSFISTTSTNASGTGRKRKTHIGPWQLGSTVGKGGTARVRKVRHAMTGQIGVAKIIPVAMAERARAISLANLVHSAERGDPTLHFDKAMPLGLEREIAIMKLLDHPNIVKLYDVWENKNEM
jgi:serine/threonine-protein kinase HSL1 (negative regulator of Swe1 kinase)